MKNYLKIKNFIFIFTLLVLTSCSNWNHLNVTYLRCSKLEEIHVHLYHHDSCEWNCLYLKDENAIFVDTIKIKYKTDRKGKITNLKLIK